MSEYSYRHPMTGARTSIGIDSELIAQGWQRWDQEADEQGRFKSFAAIKRANKRVGHHWFAKENVVRIVTPLLAGRYWVEARPNFDETGCDYMPVGVAPDGVVQYLGGCERFADVAGARHYIDAITEGAGD